MPKKLIMPKFVEGVGKRKTAVARVRIFELKKGGSVSVNGVNIKAGEFIVNLKPIQKTYPSEVYKNTYLRPLIKTEMVDKIAVSVMVSGGGNKGQIDAIAHGLAKALVKLDDKKFRPILKSVGLLTRDPRVRERRKVGTGGKARRKKQSPKR
ncbi:MAG: 30S ribosomal protein S9 [bacterium]